MSSTAAKPPATMSIHTSDSESNRSAGAGPPSFTPVNGTSGQGKKMCGISTAVVLTMQAVSPTSSQDNSPQEPKRNGNHPAPPIQNGTYHYNHEPPHHKRKRADSEDRKNRSPKRYDYTPPKSNEHPQHMADRALHVLGNNDHTRPSYYPPAKVPELPAYSWGHERQENGTRKLQHSTPEGRLAEALQHDHRRPASQQGYGPEANGATEQDSDGSPDYSMNGGPVLQTGGKRKRNFSNRTKTGKYWIPTSCSSQFAHKS